MSPITTLARVRLEVDGAPFALTTGILTDVLVQQRLSLPTLCELTFTDSPAAAMLLTPFQSGSALRVIVQDHYPALFAGQITAVERTYHAGNQREIRVRAYDPLHALRKRQTVRTHQAASVSDVARDLVGDLGLSVDEQGTSPVWDYVIQHRQSDFDLLAELADRGGMYFTVRDAMLHLLTLEGLDEVAPLVLGATLLEARLEWNAEPALRSTTAIGWNALRVETHSGGSSAARSGRAVRVDASPYTVNGSGERLLVGEQAQDSAHADALAQAELDRQIAREVTFWGVAEGDPLLRPGAKVDVQGVDDDFSGRYVITSAIHTINARSSYTTELSTLPPPRRERSTSADATIGVVTGIDGELGRVRASLSAYQDIETEWMHVLSLGAGANKGLIILPDVGDEVLVLLIGGDPAQGVVLGGLFGMKGMHDSGIHEGAVRRFTLRTPGGQRIQLNDADATIRVENSGKSFIELTPDRVTVHAEVDLTFEAPGKTITIKGNTINFERG
ncbi:MAG: contractile injection system protein, VgrG/Pvc8 family [Chloroflexota bacterium]|nr:contractile injection system protein, VgrG/Pvc8 family [Chloroflexota bacterium]